MEKEELPPSLQGPEHDEKSCVLEEHVTAPLSLANVTKQD